MSNVIPFPVRVQRRSKRPRTPKQPPPVKAVSRPVLEPSPGSYVSVFGVLNGCSEPLPRAPGQDCQLWRKKLAKGQPIVKVRRTVAARMSTAATIRPVEHGSSLVECPLCHKRIRLAKWWRHGCMFRGNELADFYRTTRGARAPIFDVL